MCVCECVCEGVCECVCEGVCECVCVCVCVCVQFDYDIINMRTRTVRSWIPAPCLFNDVLSSQ